jgi:hypothetical protein
MEKSQSELFTLATVAAAYVGVFIVLSAVRQAIPRKQAPEPSLPAREPLTNDVLTGLDEFPSEFEVGRLLDRQNIHYEMPELLIQRISFGEVMRH